MGSVIGWLIGKKLFGKVIGERGARAIAYVSLFLLIAGVLGGVVACIRRDAVSDHEQHVQQRAAPATDKAATERANDAITNAKHEEDMHNAIHSVPDAAPAGPSHALACERLRRRGNPPPACRP